MNSTLRLKSANSKYHNVVIGLTRSMTSQSETEDKFVEKGGQILNLDEVKSVLSILKSVANEKTRNLSDINRRYFNQIVQHVQRYYDLPDQYEKLYKTFTEVFGEHANPEPGTVASYIVGCSNRASVCSPVCAGSAPAPGNSDFCDMRVIWAYTDDQHNHTLISLHPSPSNKAIVYLDERFSFDGLNEAEKQKLREWNVEQLTVATFDKANGKYREILPLTAVSDIKERITVVPTTSCNSNTVFYILLIVLLLIVLYIGWRMYYSK